MRKWMFALSLFSVLFACQALAETKIVREKRPVIIVTSELSFIKYDSTFYMCDNDTPASVKQLAQKCIEVSEAAFNYALNTTDADVMEIQMEAEKKVETAPTETKAMAPEQSKVQPAAKASSSTKTLKSPIPVQKAGQSSSMSAPQSKSSTKKSQS